MSSPTPNPHPDGPRTDRHHPDGSTATDGKKRGGCLKWAGIGIALLFLLGFCGMLLDDGDDDTADTSAPATTSASAEPTPTSETEPTPEETTEPEPEPERASSEPYEGQTLIPLPVSMAEDRSGLRVDAVDIGPHIVDDVNRERGIFDKANWRVVAVCDRVEDGRLKVGAIKGDEFAAISQAGLGAGIAENRYAFMLDCPQ